ncbi:lytic transglycosylase domain-containing protein [Kribbella sp. NPDC051587]|uniref:lytic transglycosylase domain-containing protein n=1 Tax=Kribbella sp. NPDC051587 TaxID=3364119 RepID=UPI00379FDAB1
MRQQFKNLDTWRGKLTATWVCLAPPTAMVAVFVIGGVTSNTFIVDAHALAAPRPDSVFDDLVNDVPSQPGADGSLPTQEKSTVSVPVTGSTDGNVPPIPGVSGDTSGIPGTVLAAYQKVATDLAAATPNCHMTWPLLAGIGKVESDHANGGKVEANGDTRGKILGPVLNGGPGMAAISDTDQGQWDDDKQWDRAVGPMQFIPGTWKSFGADGNGDGVKNPHNVYDAARAAGDYLCSGGANLADAQGLVQSVLRYNHSMDYVSTVLRWMQSYSKTTVKVPDTPGVVTPPDDNGNVNNPTRNSTTSPTPTPTPTVTPTPPKTPTTTPTTKPPTTKPTPTPTPTKTPKPPYTPPPTKHTPTPPTTPTPPVCTPTPPTTPPTSTPESPDTPSTTPSDTPSGGQQAQADDPTTTPSPCTTPTPSPAGQTEQVAPQPK